MSLGSQRKPQSTTNQFPCENPWQTPCRQQKSQLGLGLCFISSANLQQSRTAGHAAPSPPLHGSQLHLWGFLWPCSFLAGHCSLGGQHTGALKEGFPPWSYLYRPSRFHFRDFKVTASSAKEDKKKHWDYFLKAACHSELCCSVSSSSILCPLQDKVEKSLIWKVHAKHKSFKQFAKPTEDFYTAVAVWKMGRYCPLSPSVCFIWSWRFWCKHKLCHLLVSVWLWYMHYFLFANTSGEYAHIHTEIEKIKIPSWAPKMFWNQQLHFFSAGNFYRSPLLASCKRKWLLILVWNSPVSHCFPTKYN